MADAALTPIAFALVVTDGASLRTIHPAALGPAAADLERIVRTYLFGEAPPVTQKLPPPAADTLTQREMATAQGFTGDACPHCGSFAMKRAGTCLTCQACGSTTGCG